MKPCKFAYKQVRPDSDEIFKGFGFKHLSDATQYYVHPNNQSYKGTTTLCQPIGEGVMLMSDFIDALSEDKTVGDIICDDEIYNIFMNIPVPDEWRSSGVTKAHFFRGVLENGSDIRVGAYDKNEKFIPDNPILFTDNSKLMPVLVILIAHFILTSNDFLKAFVEFARSPDAEAFVNIHEDFYQEYKNIDYNVEYSDIYAIPSCCRQSLRNRFSIIKENRLAAEKISDTKITPFAPDEFHEEYHCLIPQLSEEFLLPKNLKTLSNAIVSGDIRAILLHGPAGTGKTMSCKLICRETGMPIMETINCTESLDEFVLGKFLPDGDKIVFRESYVTKAIRYGGAVIFEEINFARPQHLAFLNSLLDDNGFVRLDNGEVVRRHKNFRFFATMNIGYYGTKELNQALYNRFNAVTELAELSDEAIKRMLTARVPECADYADKLISVYNKLKKKISSEELDLVISPRNIENWARLAKFEGYIPAAEKTIIPIAKCDRSVEDAIRGIIMLYKWNKVSGYE